MASPENAPLGQGNLGVLDQTSLPGGLVVRIRRSHRRGRGSIPRLGSNFLDMKNTESIPAGQIPHITDHPMHVCP